MLCTQCIIQSGPTSHQSLHTHTTCWTSGRVLCPSSSRHTGCFKMRKNAGKMEIQNLLILTSELLQKKMWFQPLQLLPDLPLHHHLQILTPLKHLQQGKENLKIPRKSTNFYFIFAFHFNIRYI